MPWQLQPLIWPIVIATLALLAVPHKAHPQSAALIKACYRSVAKECHAQAKDKQTFGEYRAAVGACVKQNLDKLDPRCRALIQKEFPQLKETR
jgi:hypothetical protein